VDVEKVVVGKRSSIGCDAAVEASSSSQQSLKRYHYFRSCMLSFSSENSPMEHSPTQSLRTDRLAKFHHKRPCGPLPSLPLKACRTLYFGPARATGTHSRIAHRRSGTLSRLEGNLINRTKSHFPRASTSGGYGVISYTTPPPPEPPAKVVP
jgi:hypothetical protein